jgi:hypothetical protein
VDFEALACEKALVWILQFLDDKNLVDDYLWENLIVGLLEDPPARPDFDAALQAVRDAYANGQPMPVIDQDISSAIHEYLEEFRDSDVSVSEVANSEDGWSDMVTDAYTLLCDLLKG